MDRKSLVYKGYPPNHTCVGAVLRIMPDGEWLSFVTTGGMKEPEVDNFIGLCRSNDEGEVWGPLETVLRFEGKACLFSEAAIQGDRLVLYVHTHDGRFGQWENWIISSADNGHTWTAPQAFAPMPRRAFFWTLYHASWGEWILPYQHYATDGDVEASPLEGRAENLRAMNGVLTSSDEGRTWQVSQGVGPTYGWAESNVVELSDGRLALLIRADKTGYLLRTESADHGRTWSAPVASDIPGPGSKFRLHRLSDGRIVLINNPSSRTKHPNSKQAAALERNPLAMWISDDDMQTWGYKRVLTDFPGMLAYPDGVVDEAEGYVHFVFDYNRHDVIYWGAKLP